MCPLRLAPPMGNILSFIYNDYVPVTTFQPYPVFGFALQCIDGNDSLIVIIEGIIVGWNGISDPLNAGLSQPIIAHKGLALLSPRFGK